MAIYEYTALPERGLIGAQPAITGWMQGSSLLPVLLVAICWFDALRQSPLKPSKVTLRRTTPGIPLVENVLLCLLG